MDPAFNYPPGGRRAALVNHLGERLERLPEALRPAGVRALAGEPFATWAQQPVGAWPIGVLAQAQQSALGVQTDIVRLSSETLDKQTREHPEIAVDEYPHVQDALERGRVIQENERTLIFVLEEEAGYVTVVKATQTSRAAFLTSFRRLSSQEVKRDEEIRRLLKKGASE